jgi:hypothetical protein
VPAYQLFVSYNTADRTSVMTIQKLLEARGITTFLDRDRLVPGLPWPQALEQALRDAEAVAVFIGRELGGWQKREMWFALDRQVRMEKQGCTFPVIPVLLPGADLTPCFLFLSTWIDLRGGPDGMVAAEALEALDVAIDARAAAPIHEDSAFRTVEHSAAICPYRGLQIFREEDTAFFAGRKAFVSQLLDFTRGKDFVAVVGPSGSGKSSVVQAGLLPLLRRNLPPADTWDAVTFTPGKDPYHRLATALIPLLEPGMTETDQLTEAQKLGKRLGVGDARLDAVITRVIQKSNGTDRLLLIADQFEEIFTLTPESDQQPFARTLLSALGNAPFSLMITLRADFYSQMIVLDREMSDRLAPAQVNISALTRGELRESIVAPASLVGLEFEPGLVDRIVGDVGSEPGRLPLVEFALTELWQRREANKVTNKAYDEIQGVTGALARRAEAEFDRLTSEEQTAARHLFSRLVRVARPEEAGEDMRQRADLSDADAVEKKVAYRLADARLVVVGGTTKAGASTVEVAHEALIRNWTRLRIWLNEDREFLLWRQRLDQAYLDYLQHGQSEDYLLHGAQLREAEQKVSGPLPEPVGAARLQYIRAGVEKRMREELAREALEREARDSRAAQQQEALRLAETQRAHAERERQVAEAQAFADRRRSHLAIVAAVICLALVLWAVLR